MNFTSRKRVIPVLLLHNKELVKSKTFKDYIYVGDPINAVKIFNEKEVDEIILLDIDASKKKTSPNFKLIKEIAGEAFIPLAYGGGVTTIEDADKLFYNGIEKVILNSVLHKEKGLKLMSDLVKKYGNQSVVVSLDVKYSPFGKPKIYLHHKNKSINTDIVKFVKQCEEIGAGELMVNIVQKDGMYSGYDLKLLHTISSTLTIPVIICGGASDKTDFEKAEENGASACAAGSMFVLQRPHNAILISYDI